MINPSKIMGGGLGFGGGGLIAPAMTYYVDRNTGLSGDGMSLQNAFLTFAEAVAQVNADYAAGANNVYSSGRMRRIVVGEGWYSEVPVTLTASDVHIVGNAPGNHDSIVLYGSATAGGWDITSGGPALTVTGDNCTIENIGMFTYDQLYYALQIGDLAVSTTGTKIVNCNFVRDVADGQLGGILDYGADGTLIAGCYFSTSCLTYGIRSLTNGVINPVNLQVHGCRFVGTPTGIQQDAGHNALYTWNMFHDDTSDRDDTCDTPIVIEATSGICFRNFSQGTNKAGIITGGGTILDVGNFGSDGET